MVSVKGGRELYGRFEDDLLNGWIICGSTEQGSNMPFWTVHLTFGYRKHVAEDIPLISSDRPARARAVLNTYAASLRLLIVDGVDLVQPYAPGVPPFSAGVVLVPWPNRVGDGRWLLHGEPQQLPVNEPELNNANHGLLSTTEYSVNRHDSGCVTLSAVIRAQAGYPFDLNTSVTYSLAVNGIDAYHEIQNRSRSRAPVAIGVHPYLKIGDTPTGDLIMTLPAATYLSLDSRHLPVGRSSVTGTNFDLRSGRRVGDTVTHASFADLEPADDGMEFTLRNTEGSELVLRADTAFSYAQLYIKPDFPGLDGETLAVALEPMTAPPNALASGEGIHWIEPGETWSLAWGLAFYQDGRPSDNQVRANRKLAASGHLGRAPAL